MKVRYVYDVTGCNFHTDFDLINNDETLEMFINDLEAIDGIASLTVGRYSAKAEVGIMFKSKEVANSVIQVFKNLFAVEDIAKFTMQDLIEKTSTDGMGFEPDPGVDLETMLSLGIEPSEA